MTTGRIMELHSAGHITPAEAAWMATIEGERDGWKKIARMWRRTSLIGVILSVAIYVAQIVARLL